MLFDERRLKTASRIAAAIRPLDAFGTCCSPSAVTISTSLSEDQADPGAAYVIHDHGVEFLAASFPRPYSSAPSPCSAAKPTSSWSARRRSASDDEHVSGTDERQVQSPPV